MAPLMVELSFDTGVWLEAQDWAVFSRVYLQLLSETFPLSADSRAYPDLFLGLR